jgi:uncharacterized protein (TIGR02594 family)
VSETAALVIIVGIIVLFGTMFACMFALSYRLAGMLGQLTKLLVPAPAVIPAPITIDASPVAPLKPRPSLPTLPTPSSPPPSLPPSPAAGSTPPWYQWLAGKIGFHETGNNQGIGDFITAAHCGNEGDPWCAIAVNAALESVGIPGTRSASSQSFRTHSAFVQITKPVIGAIAVFWRDTPTSGLGHVGFYAGEDATHVSTLGGNEDDAVRIEPLPKASATFGLIGYWWPKSVALPAAANGAVPATAPAPIPGIQKSITATIFSGSGDLETSAYTGKPVDPTVPGVALPLHFQGPRPKVRVSANGRSVDCEICDVGPHNTHDPYWQTGSRPLAEAQLGNRAGIDLTPAAASAIQIDGKGLVDWEFIQSPLSSPTVT